MDVGGVEMEILDEVGEEFGKEYKGKYRYRTISWGQHNKISGECTSLNPVTRQTIVNFKRLQARLLMASLIEYPKKISLALLLDETSNGLPIGLGNRMMRLADQVNGFSPQGQEEIKK